MLPNLELFPIVVHQNTKTLFVVYAFATVREETKDTYHIELRVFDQGSFTRVSCCCNSTLEEIEEFFTKIDRYRSEFRAYRGTRSLHLPRYNR